jgi:hypothetical protein
MIITPRCSGIEVISTKQNYLIENCQKKKGDNFIEKCQNFCKNNRNNLINDVNVKFTGDQGKGKSKMESIYLRAQEKLEDLDFKNIIEVASSGYHNYDGCRIPVKSGIDVDFFRKNLSDYDDRIICELLEFGAPVGFESNILEENKDIVNHKGAREFEDDALKYLYKEASYGAIIGPFEKNPFNCSLKISPLNSYKKSFNRKKGYFRFKFP